MGSSNSHTTGIMAAAADQGVPKSPEITVFCSGACYAVMEELGPAFESLSGRKVRLVSASSMGSSPESIPSRLREGQYADLLIMAASELDNLVAQGLARAGSRVDLVHSKIGMVVQAGCPRPDIRTKESFEQVLLNAKSIGYSASASGRYLAKEGFAKLGQPRYDQVMAKAKEVVKDRVGTWVARGDLEIGFQQVSELLPVSGTEYCGTIPPPYQQVTIFSIGVAASSRQPEEVRSLIDYLTSPSASATIRRWGMEPAAFAADGAHPRA